ncbi:hypothetical protein AB8890_22000 [Yersinia enterocolitica]|uniref:hypothetical protein n=1 Tax=Yersinia enterocolitica TaxID=630 RepID=UPI003D082C7D
MASYALIKNGVVENVIIWDGKGGMFSDYQVVELGEDTVAGPGWAYDGKIFTAPAIVQTPEEIAMQNLLTANAEYGRATARIDVLNEQIEDEDWTGTTEAGVNAALTSWTTYRKALRAYIKLGDGSQPLADAPSE